MSLPGGHLHFIGICGKAMGGIAASLAREGWVVTGSSEECYSPMREYLQAAGIAFRSPYRAANVPPDTECVVVAKRIAANNPELLHVLRNGIRHRSFPEFLRDQFLSQSRNVVVAGGVGKTTTTAMLTWILEHAGIGPDYLIGGLARNFSDPARFAGGDIAVLEGDEYASSFDDPRPKFLHYRPEVAVITNIIEDHPDIYANLDALCAVFAELIDLVPPAGCLIVPDWDETATRLGRRARCRLVTTGRDRSATECITDERLLRNRSCFRLLDTEFEIPLCGHMNVSNAAMAALAAAHLGVAPEQSAAALRLFRGVRNRQEEKEIGNCTLLLDKATHPHALEALAEALRQHFPGRRLVTLIQPRATGGQDWVYQRHLPGALSRFDRVILTGAHEHAPHQTPAWADTPFSIDQLASSLTSLAVDVSIARTVAEIPEAIDQSVVDDDVVVLSVLEQSEALVEIVEKSLMGRSAGIER